MDDCIVEQQYTFNNGKRNVFFLALWQFLSQLLLLYDIRLYVCVCRVSDFWTQHVGDDAVLQYLPGILHGLPGKV